LKEIADVPGQAIEETGSRHIFTTWRLVQADFSLQRSGGFFRQFFPAACNRAFAAILMAAAIIGGRSGVLTFFHHLQLHSTSFAHINFTLHHLMT
jgi:hypothetical protein